MNRWPQSETGCWCSSLKITVLFLKWRAAPYYCGVMNDPLYTHLKLGLLEQLPVPVWPAGSRLEPFEAEKHSKSAHALLTEAYKNGGGRVGDFDRWWTALRDDPEYEPALFFLAADARGEIIGVAHCWTSSFLKDLVVGEWRRRGLGRALFLHACNVFRDRGATKFALKVEDSNPSGAVQLYQRLGMSKADQD